MKLQALYTVLTYTLFVFTSCNSQEYQVTFKLDTNEETDIKTIGLRGSLKPLSNSKDLNITDENGDGIYETTVTFNTSKKGVRFHFTKNGISELQGFDERLHLFSKGSNLPTVSFNEYAYSTSEELSTIHYSRKKVAEDILVLKSSLEYIHPNIYRYRDSTQLQQDFVELEAEINENPTLENTYAAVSKFLALIRCSHTFTNPWNQGQTIKKGILFQPNKIPFTFNRIGTRLFIDKNASENEALIKGSEILAINGITTKTFMTKLSQYVTSDGSNDEKRLERLLVTGAEKFAFFDIYFPIIYSANNTYKLVLKDLNNTIQNITVNAISITNRRAILINRYGNLESSLQDGWKFTLLPNKIALLKMNSFAVQRGEFDWKNFLDNSFSTLKKQQIEHLIIDIRGNEGGQGEVGEYILKHIVQSPFTVPALKAKVRYLKIPDVLKKNMNTWDDFPYDFTGKFKSLENGAYLLKDKFSVRKYTYKPIKYGFIGNTYLITDASNSSATHLMATYAKMIPSVTIVGQETGGNQLGTNGSYIFFLRLPNSHIEIDIPVIGMQVDLKTLNDSGILPDVYIKRSVNDLQENIDTELKTILKLIKNSED